MVAGHFSVIQIHVLSLEGTETLRSLAVSFSLLFYELLYNSDKNPAPFLRLLICVSL